MVVVVVMMVMVVVEVMVVVVAMMVMVVMMMVVVVVVMVMVVMMVVVMVVVMQLEWTSAAGSQVGTLPGWPRLMMLRSFSRQALLQGPENPGEETSLAVWVGGKWCLGGRMQGDRAARPGPLPQAPRASPSPCPAPPPGCCWTQTNALHPVCFHD